MRIYTKETKKDCSHPNSTHGYSNSKLYYLYKQMIYRCTKPNNINYKYYGAVGVRVCDRWLESFTNFYEDMGDKPDDMTLERIDNSKDYSPDNCIWATYKKQNRNKSNSTGITQTEVKRMLKLKADGYKLKDIATELGYSLSTVKNYIYKKVTT